MTCKKDNERLTSTDKYLKGLMNIFQVISNVLFSVDFAKIYNINVKINVWEQDIVKMDSVYV